MRQLPLPGQPAVPLRGFSLTQPWATLVAYGAKQWETRSWSTSYRGLVAIHAAKGFPLDCRELCFHQPFCDALRFRCGIVTLGDLPRGAILCIARLTDCVRITDTNAPDGDEYEFGNYQAGRFMWRLENVRRLQAPIRCKGALGLWMVPPEITAGIVAEFAAARDLDGRR